MAGNAHASIEPAVGAWYDSGDFPECFKVVAYDNKAFVEIQYYDGEIEELEYDIWMALRPHEIAAPENAGSGYELDHEDMLDLLDEVDEYGPLGLDDHLRHMDDRDSSWD